MTTKTKSTKAVTLLKRGMSCPAKQQQLVRGLYMTCFSGSTPSLKESALRTWDRMIAKKYNVVSYWDK